MVNINNLVQENKYFNNAKSIKKSYIIKHLIHIMSQELYSMILIQLQLISYLINLKTFPHHT